MKKLLAAAAVCLCLLAMTACGGAVDTESLA